MGNPWCTWLSMMTSSNGNIFRVTCPLCGEFTGLRRIPLTKASNAELWCFLYLRLNKQLSKQSWGWWFEMPSCSLWRHCNAVAFFFFNKLVSKPALTCQKTHYNDIIMCTRAFQITGVLIVCLNFCLGTDQRKHHSFTSLVMGGFLWQRASNPENVSIWWCHHVIDIQCSLSNFTCLCLSHWSTVMPVYVSELGYQ